VEFDDGLGGIVEVMEPLVVMSLLDWVISVEEAEVVPKLLVLIELSVGIEVGDAKCEAVALLVPDCGVGSCTSRGCCGGLGGRHC